MYFDPEKNDHGLPYNPIKACVAPRPIGWISTLDAAGTVNLAPFSFFNLLSYHPPFVCFSAGGHAEDEERKDTVRNIEETGEFVYNMSTWDQRDAMNQTGMIIDREVDELAETGLEALPSTRVKPPRIKGAPAHFECVHHETVILPGTTKQAIHHLVIGQVIGVHIEDEMINDDGIFDLTRARPIARCGYKDYVVVDDLFSMEKRSLEDSIPKPQAAE